MKRKLFDKGRSHGRVILNYDGSPEGELTLFAEAFHLTAKEACTTLRQNPHFGLDHIDFRAYPIVFLYRHALELYMKALILEGAPMLEIRGTGSIDRDRLLKTHSLDHLKQEPRACLRGF